MKILYLPGRWDPTVQNEYSGTDFGAYNMLKNQPEVEIHLADPLVDEPNLIERFVRKFHQTFFDKRLIKYNPSSLKKLGKNINQSIQNIQPDVIFSKYAAPIVYTNIDRPFIYMCDSTLIWTEKYWSEFSKLGLHMMKKWEAKSIYECDRVVTFSQANADIIERHYQKEPEKIIVLPIPAYIPEKFITPKANFKKPNGHIINLLLIGKRYHLRGIDIAIDIVNQLTNAGYPSELRIAGLEGKDKEFVKFLGVFNKEEESQLQAYFSLFNWATLLLHPSRFHSAGIVISEAAAFGLPAITNASGGLATSVQHDRTGIVLDEYASADKYKEAIINLVTDPDRYQRYSESAKLRFDQELNWKVAGRVLFNIFQEVLEKTHT